MKTGTCQLAISGVSKAVNGPLITRHWTDTEARHHNLEGNLGVFMEGSTQSDAPRGFMSCATVTVNSLENMVSSPSLWYPS